jgi:hypothetical protein
MIDAQTISTSAQHHHLSECRDILKLSLGSLVYLILGMELPSTRELELETLLRQRDKEVAELSVSVLQPAHMIPLTSSLG